MYMIIVQFAFINIVVGWKFFFYIGEKLPFRFGESSCKLTIVEVD